EIVWGTLRHPVRWTPGLLRAAASPILNEDDPTSHEGDPTSHEGPTHDHPRHEVTAVDVDSRAAR
ncbi:MAG TPA: hypothetical protein VJ925_03810, partial [Longimicrobiales bacterium]|nr:hypothetical protein [Longimicrobiales bacterium]